VFIGALQPTTIDSSVADSRVGAYIEANGTVAQAKYCVLDSCEIPIAFIASTLNPYTRESVRPRTVYVGYSEACTVIGVIGQLPKLSSTQRL